MKLEYTNSYDRCTPYDSLVVFTFLKIYLLRVSSVGDTTVALVII